MLFIEALQTTDEIQAVAGEYRGTPLLYDSVEGGQSPSLTYDELAELGFALVIMPITTLLAATGAMMATLARVRADGTPVQAQHELPAFADFTDLIGLPEILDLQQRLHRIRPVLHLIRPVLPTPGPGRGSTTARSP